MKSKAISPSNHFRDFLEILHVCVFSISKHAEDIGDVCGEEGLSPDGNNYACE